VLCSKPHFTPVEWELLSDKRIEKRRTCRETGAILKKRQDEVNWQGGKIDKRDDCEYLSSLGICEIYNERPWVCRGFGAIADPKMMCKWGCRPIMSKKAFRGLLEQYADLIFEPDFLFPSSTFVTKRFFPKKSICVTKKAVDHD